LFSDKLGSLINLVEAEGGFCFCTACNVLYINSVDMESLTGPEALSRAITASFSTAIPPTSTEVHFKVSSLGITLTDNKHRFGLCFSVLCTGSAAFEQADVADCPLQRLSAIVVKNIIIIIFFKLLLLLLLLLWQTMTVG